MPRPMFPSSYGATVEVVVHYFAHAIADCNIRLQQEQLAQALQARFDPNTHRHAANIAVIPHSRSSAAWPTN